MSVSVCQAAKRKIWATGIRAHQDSGPSSSREIPEIVISGGRFALYLKGNTGYNRLDQSRDEWAM